MSLRSAQINCERCGSIYRNYESFERRQIAHLCRSEVLKALEQTMEEYALHRLHRTMADRGFGSDIPEFHTEPGFSNEIDHYTQGHDNYARQCLELCASCNRNKPLVAEFIQEKLDGKAEEE